jgi:lactam utilization protein B
MRATIIGQFTPTDFETWREFHGRQLELVKRHGVVSDRICRDISDPAKVVVITEVEDLDRFMAFFGSAEGQAMAAASPIVGQPQILMVEELERPF